MRFATVTSIQIIKPLCPENQSIKPKYPLLDSNDLTTTKAEPKTLSPPSMSLFMETVPIRADSAQHATVPDLYVPVHLSTVLYRTILYQTQIIWNLFILARYSQKKNLNSISVPLTVPLTFVQGLKTPKRKNTHFKNKYGT